MLTSLSLKQAYHKVQNSGAFRLLKLVGGFQNPAFPLLSRQKHSTYMLSYWLLFFGNQEQAGQKCNKWVENLVLIENETGKPQANNAQLSKKRVHEDQKANLPSVCLHTPPWCGFPRTLPPHFAIVGQIYQKAWIPKWQHWHAAENPTEHVQILHTTPKKFLCSATALTTELSTGYTFYLDILSRKP